MTLVVLGSFTRILKFFLETKDMLRQVIEFCCQNALFLATHQITSNKRKCNNSLDLNLYGYLYYNVVDHPEILILHQSMLLARVVYC